MNPQKIKVQFPWAKDCFLYFEPVGIGNYPYDCTDKEKHPDSMIYINKMESSWLASHDLELHPSGQYFLFILKEQK